MNRREFLKNAAILAALAPITRIAALEDAGKDSSGNACRVFIENESREDGKIRPQITTDSPELAYLESETMYSEISPIPGGVIIKIFRG